MKTSVLFLSLLVSCTFIFTNCSKDDTTTPAATAFIPLTEGTNWTYLSTENASAPVTFKLTVTNKDTVAATRTYKVIANSLTANNYMANDGSNHYRLASFPALGVSSFEDLYLKDDKAVNETWTSSVSFTYGGFPLSASLVYTLKEKGMARSVNGKNYTDVSKVNLAINVAGIGAIGSGDFYYAKGIGMIESTIAVTTPVAYSSTQQLTAYDIK